MKNRGMRQQLLQLGNGAHALATQMLGSADEAADAVQDAFVRALKAPGSYDAARGPLRVWFLCLVRNRCIDLLRRRHPGVVDVDRLRDPGMGPEQWLERQQRDAGLQRALAGLSVAQRQIITLRDYLDLSYAEIAGILDIAPGTVMSRLHRARLALKEAFTRNGETDTNAASAR